MRYEPCDVFIVHGRGWLGNSIRVLTRRPGEPPTRASHVGLMVRAGSAGQAYAVEALSHVRHAPFSKHLGEVVAVYRPLNLLDADKTAICARAFSYVGKGYGYLKIAAHAADWLLGGAYVFRRLAIMDNYPICSWLVAHSYKAAGKHFGVPDGAASPDDIDDFVRRNPDKYECVWPLRKLTEEVPDA